MKVVDSEEAFNNTIKDQSGLIVLHFCADWAPQCETVNNAITELEKDPQYKKCLFVGVLAESVEAVSVKYSVGSVPTCVILHAGKEVDRVDGANTAQLTQKLKAQVLRVSVAAPQITKSTEELLHRRLQQLINTAPCMLFMKGNPTEPKCGFSRTIIGILDSHNTQYSTFDILQDEEVRQGLKTYSNWPTYPQLYINGELVGGLDIIKEMEASGELQEMLPKKSTLNERLEGLVKRSPLMVFMKGSPSEPKCGFSRTLVQMLNTTGLEYDTFDILADEEVRQGLKKFSDWPTYPQVYVRGDLIGGLDIIKELEASGDLISSLQ